MNCTYAGQKTESVTQLAVVRPGRSEAPLTEQHLRNLSLSRSQPALFDAMSLLVATADPLMRDMEENLDQLKESFVQVVDELFREGGIDVSKRLIIGFENGALKIADRTHPQANQADALLTGMPVLSAVLRQIAADTLLVRRLDALTQAFVLCTDVPPIQLQDDDATEHYQVCLKGPLSHFYYA